MELLQKFTLYDLLGYMLPGWVVVYMAADQKQKMTWPILNVIAFFVFSYLTGILISEATRQTQIVFGRRKKRMAEGKTTGAETIYERLGIPANLIEDVLLKRKLLEPGQKLSEADVRGKYLNHMYSDIQVDPKYVRVHNYASAEVLYKNLAAAFLVCSFLGICRMEFIQFVFFLIGTGLFYIRQLRFREKKKDYTIQWFIEKYSS